MKICILFQADYPPEPRLARTVKSLLATGHQVELFCDNRNQRVPEETIDGIRIVRVKKTAAKLPGVGRLLGLPVFWNPLWLSQFLEFVRRGHFDVIHVINLPLAPLALLAGRYFKTPVIYDMYENYPAAIRIWKPPGLFNRIFRNAAAAEILDRWCVRHADHIVVVIEEAKEYFKKIGVDENKISVVHNTVDLRAFHYQTIHGEIVQRYRENFTIVYTGKISPERGLETAIQGMPFITRHIPNAKLVIVGGGPSETGLRKLVSDRKIQHVEFTGWVDEKLLRSYVEAADVCIVTQPSNPFIDTTMPNKLFEYMAVGKPVVVSDAKPLARVVRECQCGEIFSSGSSESFAKAICSLYANGQMRGENGKHAVLKTYNWEISSQALINLYNQLP